MQNLAQIKLKKLVLECDKHQLRIESAYHKIENKLPLNSKSYLQLSEEEIEHIDQFLFRFAKLQDAIGQRFFKAILSLLQEDVESLPFIDILNKLEKLNLIQSSDQWLRLREIRNVIAHEYDDSPELMSQSLNAVFAAKVELFGIYNHLKDSYLTRQES